MRKVSGSKPDGVQGKKKKKEGAKKKRGEKKEIVKKN